MPDLRSLLHTRPFVFALLLSAVLLAVNVIAQPSFGDPGNWPGQLATLAPLALVAMASTPSILSGGGGLDLSVGPLLVFCNVVLVRGFLPHGIDSAWTAVPLLLAIGAAIGAINGVLVAVLRYQPVIATLCTFFILTGVNVKVAAEPHPAGHNWTEGLGDKVGFVPGALLLMAVPVVIWLVLSRTAFHRQLYAVGGNDATAFSAGVNVAAVRVAAYALGGVFAAVGGIALTALVQSSQASGSAQYTLIALAAVAVGGTVLGGGRGGLLGSLLGAVAIYLMQTLLSALSVPPTWLNVVYGGMLVVGVLVGARVTAQRPAVRPAIAAPSATAATS
jgi:ribose transport system permease protein